MRKIIVAALVIPAVIYGAVMAANWWQHYIFPLKYTNLIADSAERHKVDPYLITAIIYEESRFRSESESRAGALGLMQIMPETAVWISQQRQQQLSSDSLRRPKENIAMGTWYFDWLRQKYGSENLALAAYNSGDRNLDRWLSESEGMSETAVIRSIPFKETREFVYKVQASRRRYKELYPEAF